MRDDLSFGYGRYAVPGPLMGRWSRAAGLLACLAPAASSARIEIAAVDAAGRRWAEPLALKATEASTGIVRHLGMIRGGVTLQLPSGSWTLEAEGNLAWGMVGSFPVEPDDRVLRWNILVHRTAVLTGPLEATPLPSGLVARVRSASTPDGAVSPVLAMDLDRKCIVAGKQWRCELPVGRWDVRLHSDDHVPLYLWQLDVEPQGREDFRLVLQSGPSVAGFVGSATPSNAPVLVQLAAPDGRAVLGRDRRPAFVATPGPRGFFQVAGLPSGRYLAQLVAGDAVLAQSDELEVHAKGETMLDAPLSAPEGRGWVRISPPVDGRGQPWTVRIEGPAAKFAFATDGDGRLLLPHLPRGAYRLSVLDSKPGQWHLASFDVGDEQPALPIELDAVRLRGEVRLAGEPLGAKLTFLARGVQVLFQSDDNGRFEGLLPLQGVEGQTFRVRVRARAPVVERVVDKVRVEVNESREAGVVIDLPSGQLEGTLVDPQGRSVREPVRVTLDRADGNGANEASSLLTDSGAFTVAGLEQGRYVVGAAARDLETVVPEEVSVRSGAGASVRLVLAPSRKLGVRIVDQVGGAAVPGAQVLVFPAGQAEVGSSTEVSDAEGRVRTLLPPDAGPPMCS